MIQLLNHRGPDGYGIYEDVDVVLAHARLSIIDLSTGNQPIHNEDRTVWVVFNGEIFNYLELRQELEKKGHRFYTRSDTEVIVHLYEEHGDRCVEMLNGQFAIAIWDSGQRRCVLGRDRVGIRPLFYTIAQGKLWFASEIKAFSVTPAAPSSLDMEALGQVMTFWSVLPPRTAFSGISSLPPGHVMILEEGRMQVRQYWDWSFPGAPQVVDEQALADELRALLIDSIRLQLRADVPVGAYLSGGLDSSIISALVREHTTTTLNTFSVTFDDAEFDESAYQQQMVEHLGTQHQSVHCSAVDIGRMFPRVVWHAESPLVRTAPAPLIMLSAAVRKAGYKVVLTGEGADEVFAGYDLFKEAKVRRFLSAWPESRFRQGIFGHLYPYLTHSPTQSRNFARQFFLQGMTQIGQPGFAHIPRWSSTRRIWQFFSGEMKQQLNGADPLDMIAEQCPVEFNTWQPLEQDQYVEAHTLLSGYLLSSQGDRMATANSIEARFPFLDHRVIEFASRLPPKLKLRALREKYILKRAVQGLVPESVRVRPKQPYRSPDSQCFFERGKPMDYVMELLGEKRLRHAGYFDPGAVNKLLEKCRSARAIGFVDNMAFVSIVSTMILHDLYLCRGTVCGTMLRF